MTRSLPLLLLLSMPMMVFTMVIWPDLVRDEERLSKPKPTTWSEKNLGQWCRNFTVNRHTQCPQASAFHQYNCCGEHNTDCCFAIQGWVIIVTSFVSFAFVVSFLFYLMLKFQIICLEHSYPPKVLYLEGKR
ncbi:unnamed protein product [Heligmosomoides polygyrus]|uniref:Transmembrane protein n=1 Tax=Heligmosomoides polygyrus TaxID=6339 RepID=A0A3P7ZJU2_HELPZ|nr:unnamed protein product [Heligmosomoides polygyrus]